MGLFVLPLSEDIKGNVDEAIANLELFKEDGCQPRSHYLLGFARSCINAAEEKLDQPIEKIK